LSQAFRLTLGAAGKPVHKPSVRFHDSPIGDFGAGIMGDGLKGFLGCNRACPADIELLRELPAEEIGRDEPACRVFSINAATVAGPGKSILPAPPKKRRRSFGISTMASSLGSIVFPVSCRISDRSGHIITAWPAGEGRQRVARPAARMALAPKPGVKLRRPCFPDCTRRNPG
jgi:hypothetical protein